MADDGRPDRSYPALPNFRDVGGHRTHDGRLVRPGLLYRSVALDKLIDLDQRAFAGLGIRTVFDLRTELEQTRRPDRLPEGVRHVSLDLLADSGEADPAVVFALMEDPPRASAELGEGGTQRFYVATYRDMVRLPSACDGYAALYRTLADARARPALIHCTTGKDRTGWAVAALLLFLGVPESDVLDEYMISDLEVRRAYEPVVEDFIARGGSRDVIEPLMSVHPSFLEAALEVVRHDFGSIETYFTQGLGLGSPSLEGLQQGFLE